MQSTAPIKLLDVIQVAKLLAMDVREVHVLVQLHGLPVVDFGDPNDPRFKLSDIVALIESRTRRIEHEV